MQPKGIYVMILVSRGAAGAAHVARLRPDLQRRAAGGVAVPQPQRQRQRPLRDAPLGVRRRAAVRAAAPDVQVCTA